MNKPGTKVVAIRLNATELSKHTQRMLKIGFVKDILPETNSRMQKARNANVSAIKSDPSTKEMLPLNNTIRIRNDDSKDFMLIVIRV